MIRANLAEFRESSSRGLETSSYRRMGLVFRKAVCPVLLRLQVPPMTTQTASRPMAQGASVWRGEAQHSRQWLVPLDEPDCLELIRSAEVLRGRALDSIQRSEFPVPRVAPKLAGLCEVLERGAGFAMLRGLPAASVPEDVLRI